MTAVEWLEVQINERIVKRSPHDTIIIQTQEEVLEELFIQAKEMEKQQIIEAHGDKQKTKNNPGSIVTYGYTYTTEMYYNEKFKK